MELTRRSFTKYLSAALKSKSYNGCVSVEPFNKKLNNMEESAKLQMVFKSIHDTFSLIKNS